jgi:hypothetical protein
VEDGGDGAAAEGRLAGEELVERGPEREQVGAGVDRMGPSTCSGAM